jgi:glycosyltransferase involved in cell wall biosynthesis
MARHSLRIAISAHLLHGQGGYRSAGIHTYIEQVVRHLPEADPALQLTLFTAHPPADLPASIAVRRSRWPTERPPVRIAWEQLVLPLAARRADVLHATAFVAPIVHRCPAVITVYDLSFELFPQYFRGFNQTYLRIGARYAARHARRLIAISDNTRRDVQRLYGVPLDRIDVAYPGVDPNLKPCAAEAIARFRREKNLPDKFLLFLGTLEPRKNLITLIRAYAIMKRDCPDARLVLAGGIGWLADDILAAIKTAGVEDSLLLPGYVAAEEKALWLSSATAFVYPSSYEGFGLPPLEAMACGTPVIVSNAASLPEVIGEAGLSIGPQDISGWAEVLRRVWVDSDLRSDLRARGIAQSGRFTWLATARDTAAAYRRALEPEGESPA